MEVAARNKCTHCHGNGYVRWCADDPAITCYECQGTGYVVTWVSAAVALNGEPEPAEVLPTLDSPVYSGCETCTRHCTHRSRQKTKQEIIEDVWQHALERKHASAV